MNLNENFCTTSRAEPMVQPMGKDALTMVTIIDRHLFGDGKELANDTEPKCYRDAMKEHCETLRQLCGGLQKIIDLMGCNR